MAHDDANGRYDSPNETDDEYGPPYDPETRSDAWFARRGFLKLAGVATSGIAATGLADTASAATTVSGIQFDRVVDAVDDLGMDSSGNQPIDGALDRALESGTLVEFPPGTYRFEDSHYLDGESRVGIRGTGSSHRDVRFVSPRGSRLKFLRGDNVRSVLLENFSLDHRMDDDTLISLVVVGPGGSVLKDIEWLGQTPSDSGSDYNVTVEATDQDGVQLVEHLVTGVDAPSVKVQYPNGVQFMRGGPAHRGEVIIRDLVVHNHNSNGTRYTHCTGVVTIEGGEFVNNQNASVRFGAGDHPSKVSTCTGTYIKADGSRNAADAIRLDASGNGYSGSQFRDVHIDWGDEDGRAVIASPDWGGHGRASFSNCVVRNEGPLPTVFADDPDGYSGDGAFVFENCSFTGAGGDFITRGREGCAIRDSCIDMPNAGFSGFTTENITNGSCPLPRDSGTSGGDGSSNDDTATDLPNTLRIEGTGTATNYEFAVSGDLAEDPDGGDLEEWDTLEGSTANGWVTTSQHADGYRFSGELTDFVFHEGSADVYVNGEPMDDGSGSSDEPVEHTLTIRGTGTAANYEFAVSGDLGENAEGGTLESWDTIEGSTATGWVTTSAHVDSFLFTGELTEFAFAQGSATVTVDGEEIDVGPSEPVEHTLTIRGSGTATNYEFTVSGDLEENADGGALERWDTIEGSTATGWVTTSEHVDSFRFTGDVTDFGFARGSADVYLDGTQVAPGDL